MLDLAAYYQNRFKGTWTAADLHRLRVLLEDLESYGVYLNRHDFGTWSLPDVEKVHSAVELTAQGLASIIKTLYGIEDDKLGFRLLYAPLRIARNPTNNVSLVEGETWWARNSNGYEIILSNRAFFDNTVNSMRGQGLTFTSVELIAHEIGHTINWRYKLRNDSGKVVDIDAFYANIVKADFTTADGETVTFKSVNDGYAIAPRSSDGVYETVKDAITSLVLNRFKDDPKGAARREQILDLMKRIIEWRVKDFGDYDALKATMLTRWRQGLVNRLSPALGMLQAKPTLNDHIAALKAVLPA